MSCLQVLVGSLTLTAPETIKESFECAAWSREVVLAPGTYPVFAYLRWTDGRYQVDSLSAVAEGDVTAASFRSYLGGAVGSDFGAREIGTRKITHLKLPKYGVIAKPERLVPVLSAALKITEWDAGPACTYFSNGMMWRYEVTEGVKFTITTPEGRRYGGATLEAEVALCSAGIACSARRWGRSSRRSASASRRMQSAARSCFSQV